MLQFENTTGFAGMFFVMPNADGIDSAYVVVKGTFALGRGLTRAETQVPPVLASLYYGDPATSSIRLASDISLMKPGTDVVVHGFAHAPNGVPTWQSDVSVTVGTLTKRLRVFGDRVWDTSQLAGSIAWVAPFERMPLVWERAYGGTDSTDRGLESDARNPAGVGFRAKRSSRPLNGMPLPNIEDPAALITSPGDSPAPSCFASVAPHWQPRLSYAGTYDDAWQQSRAPYLPKDFDARFFQVAAPGLCFPSFLQGGEPVELRGMTPSGLLSFHLPSIRVQATFVIDGAAHPSQAVMDGLLIEPEESRFSIVWRATQTCDKKVLQLNEIRVELLPAA